MRADLFTFSLMKLRNYRLIKLTNIIQTTNLYFLKEKHASLEYVTPQIENNFSGVFVIHLSLSFAMLKLLTALTALTAGSYNHSHALQVLVLLESARIPLC